MGWWGSVRDLSKNILKQGWVKAKVVRRGEGALKVSSSLPPVENFNHTPVKFPFQRYIVYWGKICRSKIIGGGGGAPRATFTFYSVKLCTSFNTITVQVISKSTRDLQSNYMSLNIQNITRVKFKQQSFNVLEENLNSANVRNNLTVQPLTCITFGLQKTKGFL